MDAEQISQILDARRAAQDAARPRAVASAHAAGGQTARERIDALTDAGSLVEYGVLASTRAESALGAADEDSGAADGLVAGAATVHGQPVIVAAYDTTVAAGTQSDRNQRKLAKVIYLAVEHRWPFVCFVEGDGARANDGLTPPPIAVAPRGRWDPYEGLAELSGWAPTVAVVTGRALDGHAGLAMLVDCVIATAGATLGARDPHTGAITERSVVDYAKEGHVDLIVEDEPAAIHAARAYLGHVARPVTNEATQADSHDQLADVIPANRRRAYDMRKIIAGIADEGSVLELGRDWATSMITALARIGGHSVGIFANQPSSPLAGAIDALAADKSARFIELCDTYEIPLVALIDNPGYMVGPVAEREGIARHHARPLSALHHRTVPLYSVQLRKAYGLGPYAMAGFGASRRLPDLRLAWPSVESGGMSLEGAAYLVKRKEILAAGSPEEARAIRDNYAETLRDAASGIRAGRSFAFDDVILPTETRGRILTMLQRTPRRTLTAEATKKHVIDLR